MINAYQAKYFAYELSKKSQSDSAEKFGATLMDARVELNPHQVEAALFAFKSPYSKGAILADEVGLGKTIEAGILLSQKWAEGQRRILIICPSSLRKQWLNEMADKFYLPCEVVEARSFRNRMKSGSKNPFDNPESIKIASFHYARNKAEYIQLCSWDLVVIDEAHYLRNVYKPSHHSARDLRKAVAPFKKVLLTATPLQNRLEELYGLVSILDQNIFGDLKTFRKDYVSNSGGQDIGELKERLQNICHRTLRRDVREFINFKGRIPFTQTFQPTAQEQELYDLVLEYLRKDDLYALPIAQRHLIESVIFKLLGSSTFAIAKTLEGLIGRLRVMLQESEVTYDEMYLDLITSDFDVFTAEDEDVADVAPETRQLTADDQISIETEIAQLESFLVLANSIEHNAKGENLIIALEKGFEELERLGAKSKALIFTESTRTQQYLYHLLLNSGYAGKIVLFNGSNADPLSGRIYDAWTQNQQNIHKVKGSKQVDMRNALVDAFQSDAYQIMIGTEAAAEGLNLQFCSMVVNYDLPWNPQRVEQRIGRCHRYGQEYDVVVVNFLNAGNVAERRIFQLLDQKFKLFDGVFGASDDVLGAIESGVDFESRIISIYKQCRTKEEINASFDALQEELKTRIQSVMKETQAKLFEHFDAQVIDKLRTTLVDTKTYISLLEQWLWAITRYYLHDKAIFRDEEYTFTLHEDIPGIASKNIYTFNKKREDANHYRVAGELAQTLIAKAKKEVTPPTKLSFAYSASSHKHAGIERLKSKSGYMKLVNLQVHSDIEDQDLLIFGAANDNGELLEDEICQYILRLTCQSSEHAPLDSRKINEIYDRQKKKHLAHLENNDARLFQQEAIKFTRWAEDKIEASEIEYREIKGKIADLNREVRREGITADELLVLQEKIAKLEKKRKKLKIEMFDIEDDIIAQRDQMIEEARTKINRTFTETELFTIAWEIN